MRRIIWFFIFISMLYLSLASASNVSSTDAVDNSSNAGSDMVSTGLDTWLSGSADSMISSCKSSHLQNNKNVVYA